MSFVQNPYVVEVVLYFYMLAIHSRTSQQEIISHNYTKQNFLYRF